MKTILVPTDFSEFGNNAVLLATGLAEKTGARLIIQHNVSSLAMFVHHGEEETDRKNTLKRISAAEKNFAELLKSDFLRGIDVQHIITEGTTDDEILKEANRIKADLLVIGSHQNEGSRVFIGSMTQKIMREAVVVCPVLTVNHPIVHCNWKNVLIPASFDHEIVKPLGKILEILSGLNSVFHLLFVNTPGHFKSDQEIAKAMASYQELFPDTKFEMHVINSAEIESGILDTAAQLEADLIAMYSHNRMRKESYNIGSTETVAFRSQIPVLTVLCT